jgi:hypothetical protein
MHLPSRSLPPAGRRPIHGIVRRGIGRACSGLEKVWRTILARFAHVRVCTNGPRILGKMTNRAFAISVIYSKCQGAANTGATCRSPERPLRSRQVRASIYENAPAKLRRLSRELFRNAGRSFRDRFLNFVRDNACASNSHSLERKPKGQNPLPFNSHYPFPRVPQGSFECHSCLVMNHIANARHAHNPKVVGSNPTPATKKSIPPNRNRRGEVHKCSCGT